MTIHAILIGVRVSDASADPAANAIAAISSARHLLVNLYPGTALRLSFLSSDVQAVTSRVVLDAFAELQNGVQDGDTILVMFAGHGKRSDDKFIGWSLSGGDSFSSNDLRARFRHSSLARWIVISDCCYGAAITESSFLRRARQSIQRFLRTIFRRSDPAERQFKRLAESTVTELTPQDHDSTPADLIVIAGASATDLLSDGGQLLLATLIVGSTLGQLTYGELHTSFRLVDVSTQSFVCQRLAKYDGARVLAWDPPQVGSVVAGHGPVDRVRRNVVGSR